MSLNQRFKQFMDQVEWGNLDFEEQRALFDATDGNFNENGVPFSVSEEDGGAIIVIRYNDDAELRLHRKDIAKFRRWLEKTYLGGEMCEAYFPVIEEIEKDRVREEREMKSGYEIEQLVLSILKERYSRFSIAKHSYVPFGDGMFFADFAVFDRQDHYRLIIETKPSHFINGSFFLRHFGQILPVYPDVAFILTDGNIAILRIAGEHKIARLLFTKALDAVLPIDKIQEKPLIPLDEIKQYFHSILDVFKEYKYEGEKGNKLTLLQEFVNILQEENIKFDTKDPSYLYFTDSTESEFFQIILGLYEGDRIVKYGYDRSLDNILDYKTINMCSLVCMNDPSEGTYANNYMKIEPREEDKTNIPFIISGCPEDNDDNLTMWRLYANDAKGVSITFDINKGKLSGEFYLAPISYSKSEYEHFELDLMRLFFLNNHHFAWKFTINNWYIWKHFFKKHIYADEHEVRLLYMPKNFDHDRDGKWFIDDRTSIRAEMAIFSLTDVNTPFPLTLRKIRLGPKFPASEINVNQYNQHFKLRNDILIAGGNREAIVIPSDIEDYR